jgi:hypothetical protein
LEERNSCVNLIGVDSIAHVSQLAGEQNDEVESGANQRQPTLDFDISINH